MIKVVAAFIKKNNKFLIAKRSTGDLNVLGKWEFPGGKVEEGETELKAIEREIREEFEIVVEAQKFMANHIHDTGSKKIDLRLYECKYVSGTFNLHDHLAYEWVTFDEAKLFDLAPADILLLEKIEGEINDGN